MNFKLILSALRARYRLFFLILLITVSTTLVVSLLIPKSYVAQVSLLLDGKDEQSMRTNTNVPQERERAGYLQTQVDILTSPKVTRRVIADANLTKNPDVIDRFKSSDGIGTLEDWLAEGLSKQIKVETSQSSLIQLSFTSPDPDYSARIANGYAKAYVDTVLELRVEPTRQTSIWFDEQLKGLRDNMAQAEQRLTSFQQEHGIVAKEEHLDIDNIQLTNLAGQLASAGNGIAAERSGPASSAVVQRLKAELLRSEAKLQEASVNFGSKHPQYQRQMADVLTLRQNLAEETGNAIALSASSAERSRQSRKRLLVEIAAQRDRVLGLKQARNQLVMLNHDVDMAQRTYDTAMQRFMASKIESRALQTNVSVLDQALPPSRAARPRIGLNIALSLFIGTLLGIAVVSLFELLDQRVRLLDDLSDDLQVPLLAVLSNDTPTSSWLPALPAPRHALPAPG